MDEKIIEGQAGESCDVAAVSCQPGYMSQGGQARGILIGGIKRFANAHPRATRDLGCITIIGLAATAILDAFYVLVAGIDGSGIQPKAIEPASIS